MGKSRSIIPINELEKWDVILVQPRALEMHGHAAVYAFVAQVFYEGNEVCDVTLFPILPAADAKERFRFPCVEVTSPAAAGVPQNYVVVPTPYSVRATSLNLETRNIRGPRAFAGRQEIEFVNRMGALDTDHPGMSAILSATDRHENDDRPKRKPGDFRMLDWERVEGATEIGSLAKKEVDAENEALRPKRVYNRTNAKKTARKKQNVSSTVVYDLTINEITSTFDVSAGLKTLFNTLSANPDTASLTLRDLQTVNIADAAPHIFERQSAKDLSVESVADTGLLEQGGIVGTPQLMKFLHGLHGTPIANQSFNTLATMDRKGLYALPGIGPRNITPVITEIAAVQARLENAVAQRALLDPKAITRELKAIRTLFLSEAMAIAAGTATPDVLSKYQDPATKGPGQTPVYFHAKLLKV